MADDSNVPPLPRRIPGASGSPRPSAGVERAEIPEDLRRRVLSAIAIELERDRAEQQRAEMVQGVPGGQGVGQVPGGAGADGATLVGSRDQLSDLDLYGGATLFYDLAAPGDAAPAGAAAPDSDASLAGAAAQAEDAAPAEDAARAEDAAPPSSAALEGTVAATGTTTPAGDANLADAVTQEGSAGQGDAMVLADSPTQAGWFTPHGGTIEADSPTQAGWFTPHGERTSRDAAAQGHDPEEAVPRPSVFTPRRAADANGAAQPPALLGRQLGPEAHTEPLPKISGFRVNPAAMARTQPVPPPATPASATSPAVSTPPETVPSEPDPQAAVAPTAAAPEATRAAPQVPGASGPASSAEPSAPTSTGYSWLTDLQGTPSGEGPTAGAAAPLPAKPPAATQSPPRPRRQGRPYRIAGLILSVVALVAAGAVALVLSGRAPTAGHTTGPGAAGHGAAAAVRNRAAAWVAGQVSRTAKVACDPVTCQALRAYGVPTSSLYKLGPQTTTPLGSQIIVATAAVRARFGYRLGTVYAPAVLASFGSGLDRIDIRLTAPQGAAAYLALLRADRAHRVASGTELLHNSRITATALARQQLAAGQVDMRLLITIAQLAAAHPVYIMDFGAPPPGAGLGVPLRQADLAEGTNSHQHPGRVVSPGYVRFLISFLYAQRGPFRPMRVRTVYQAGGVAVVRIAFGAPSPLGLTGPHA